MFSFLLDYFPLKKEIIVSDITSVIKPMAVSLIWAELFLCLYFPCGSAGKESACSAGDLDSIPGLGRSLGGGKGYPLQYSGLENSMDCIVHGVAKNQTRLSDFHFSMFKLLMYIINIILKWSYL